MNKESSEVKVTDSNDATFVAMQKKIEDLTGLVMTLLQDKKEKTVPTTASVKDDHIKIVHLVDRAPGLSTLISLSNLEISMRYFGEERSLSIQQFEELIGKYRAWFTMGILAVHSDYEHLAKHYGLSTNYKYPIDAGFYNTLGTKTMQEIEDIFPRLPQAGQDSLLSYWVREARKGNRQFADIRKIETLNRLSDGALTQLIAEINAKNNKK